jgi:hypothetical protein
MMDILTIAQREGDRAYREAEGAEASAAAYLETVAETRKRGRKAEEILASGLVSPNGEAGSYYVRSQDGNGRYTVNLDARTCDCPDRDHRGAYCKHLQAAELYAAAQGPEIKADGERVVLEVEGYARGRQLIDKRLSRVRVNGGSYREAKTKNFDKALSWLRSEGYELADVVAPAYTMGSAKVLYIYERPEAPGAHDDALPAQPANRRRDRLFKAEGGR